MSYRFIGYFAQLHRGGSHVLAIYAVLDLSSKDFVELCHVRSPCILYFFWTSVSHPLTICCTVLSATSHNYTEVALMHVLAIYVLYLI